MDRSACLLALVGVFLVGCVPQSVHDQTRKDLEKAQVTNADLVRKYNQAMNAHPKEGADVSGQEIAALRARLSASEAENARLRKSQGPATFTSSDATAVGVQLDARGGIPLGAALLFDEGSAQLRPAARGALDSLAAVLESRYPGERFAIEGNTDNQELSKTRVRWQYNMRLGWERAYAVFQYFLKKGIPEKRMLIRANSFNDPVDPATQNSDAGRMENRRVVVRRVGTKV